MRKRFPRFLLRVFETAVRRRLFRCFSYRKTPDSVPFLNRRKIRSNRPGVSVLFVRRIAGDDLAEIHRVQIVRFVGVVENFLRHAILGHVLAQHVKGGKLIVEKLEELLGVSVGVTSSSADR